MPNDKDISGKAAFYYSKNEREALGLKQKGTKVYAGSTSSSAGAFSCTIRELSPSTTYYYIAVIIIDEIEFAGEVKSFTTKSDSSSGIEDISYLYGVYSCKSFKAYEWEDGAAYYDFDLTISKKNENDRTIWISNIDPLLKKNEFADYENRVTGKVNIQNKTITVASGQKLYGDYFFKNADSDDNVIISIQNDGKKLLFQTTWGLFVDDDNPGWIEVYPAGLTLSRSSGHDETIPVTSINIDQKTASMTVGESLNLTATVLPSNATDKTISWASNDTNVASVSSTGVVTAKAKGTAIITATTNDGGYTSSCTVTVSDAYIAVSGVSLNHTSLEIEVETEATLVATVSPSDATNKKIVWSSSNTSMVTVDQNGTIKGIKIGTAAIMATTEDGNKTAYCTVTVTKKKYDSSALSGEASNISCRNVKIAGKIPQEIGDIPDDARLTIWISKNSSMSDTETSIDTQIKNDRSFEGVNTKSDLEPDTKYYYKGYLSGNNGYLQELGSVKSFTTSALSTMIETYNATDISYSGATFNAKLDLTDCIYSEIEYGILFTPLDGTSWIGSERTYDIDVKSSNNVINNRFSLRQMLLPGTRYEYTAYVRFTLADGSKKLYKANNSEIVSTANSPEVIDLGLSVKWRAWNLGASKPEETGGYYAWGEIETKTDYSWSTYKWSEGRYDKLTKYNTDKTFGAVDNKTDLKDFNFEDDAARRVLGNNWRIPALSEWTELIESCSWIWITINGMKGYLVKSKINDNILLLPAAGYMDKTSLSPRDGSDPYAHGYYWASSIKKSYRANGLYFTKYSVDDDLYGDDRYYGCSIRPVRE